MGSRFPIIIGLEQPKPAYRWRLVASAYQSARAVVEGSVVLIMVLTVAMARAHVTAFAWLEAGACLVLLGRLLDRRSFLRAWAIHSDAMPGTPESWMRRLALGAVANAALWGGQDICALLLTSDPQLQFVVLMVQAGWIAGACVRMAACPAAVLGQIVFSLCPTVICLIFVPDGLIKIAIPAGLLHIVGLLWVSHALGLLLAQNIQSEQRIEAANTQLAEANAKLTRLTLLDGLTGIANRRAFDEALEVEWARATRHGHAVSLLMVDVDFFKLYNDRYGHLAGDDCLRLVAAHVAASVMRPADLAARYGGEEFAGLLTATGERGALDVAERLRLCIANADLPHESAPLGRISVSIGIACLVPAYGEDRRTLIRLADAALYEAKRGGRNRVHIAVHAHAGGA